MDERNMDLFRREYAIVSRLVHGHILKPRYFDICDNRPFLIMDLCEGGTLYHLLKRYPGGMPEKEVALIMWQIGSALAYLHEQKIAHQDLKPENIFLLQKGHYVLADFGVSSTMKRTTMMLTKKPTLQLDDSEADMRSEIYLTPEYASPEAWKGKGNTAASDVFSFGVMLYELLSGKLPFQYPVYTGQVLGRGEPMPVMPDKISPAMQQVVEACLEADPKDRQITAEELAYLGRTFYEEGSWPYSSNRGCDRACL